MKKHIALPTKLASVLIVAVLVLAAYGSSPTPLHSYSSSTSTPQPSAPPKWANITLTGEDESFLEGITWVRTALVTYWVYRGGIIVPSSR
jgi:hypothetical protein